MKLQSFIGFGSIPALLLLACGSEAGGPSVPPPAPEEVAPPIGSGAPAPEEPICAEATGEYSATREPANVLFLLDRSGSMHIELPTGATRWEAMKSGFGALLKALPPTTSAGAMLFPQGDAPVNAHCRIDPTVNDVRCDAGWPEPSAGPRCSWSTYQPGVPSAALSAQQTKAILDHVAASDKDFYWGTPLASALWAAIAAQKTSPIKGARSVVLLTDGNPTSCGDAGLTNDIQNVVDAAAEGLNGMLVRTFVVGVVDSARQAARAENLSPIAVAGGTARTPGCEASNSCFYPVSEASFTSDLKKAFDEISLQAFDCTFNLPAASADTDPAKINVRVSDASGTRTIARDPSRKDGWDYLPNGSQIQLYGTACLDMKEPGAKLRVVLGCKTVEAPPAKPTN